MFGPGGAGTHATGVRNAFLSLCERAGVQVTIPEGVESLCCGTPWTSKGSTSGHETLSERAVPLLRRATGDGTLPVISDGVSCTEGFANLCADAGMTIVDAVEFVVETILPKLTVRTPMESIVVHPTCSSTHLGVTDPLIRIARAISDDVVVPDDWGCCGFAGDRGMLHPELTASATRAEAAEVSARTFTGYASANRTCEIAMTRATGKPYRHILELLDDATRP
jgi:D-lactate dehydrogenase